MKLDELRRYCYGPGLAVGLKAEGVRELVDDIDSIVKAQREQNFLEEHDEIIKELRARIDLVDARSQGIERMTIRFQAACQSEAVNPAEMGLIPSYLRNRLDQIEAARLTDTRHRLELQRRIEDLQENKKVEKNMDQVFNVGDLVTHRCGNGPKMVVCQINADRSVRCRWFSKDDQKFIADQFQGNELATNL